MNRIRTALAIAGAVLAVYVLLGAPSAHHRRIRSKGAAA